MATAGNLLECDLRAGDQEKHTNDSDNRHHEATSLDLASGTGVTDLGGDGDNGDTSTGRDSGNNGSGVVSTGVRDSGDASANGRSNGRRGCGNRSLGAVAVGLGLVLGGVRDLIAGLDGGGSDGRLGGVGIVRTTGGDGGLGNNGGGVSGGGRLVDDAELSGVLVITSRVDDELDTVAGGLAHEVGGRGPGVGTAIRNVLHDGVLGDDVLGGALKEDEGDGALSGRLNHGKSAWKVARARGFLERSH